MVKKLTQLALISLTLIISTPSLTWAKSVEEEIKDTGILKVGVRDDSPLFGFGADYVGYCADFAYQLGAKLGQDINKEIKVELIKSTTQNRWELVNQNKVHLECGPNTITSERETEYNIIFSHPFFVTATQIFTKINIPEETLRDGVMGAIAGTTNEEQLKSLYNPDKFNNSYQNRNHGIADVIMGDITGFASDGILLMGTALAMEVNLDQYTLVTPLINERPFCASYGMILPTGEENSQWRDTVNKFISENEQGSEVWDTWFTASLPYIGAVLNNCQDNQPLEQ